jgi:RimJ/RimL family protein N-acetyltransferase
MHNRLQPILEDDVLLIRPLQEEDFDDLYKVASDPQIWEQHQNNTRYTHTEFSVFFKEGIAGKGAFAILDKNSNEIIGSSRYRIINEEERVVEIGWSFLGTKFWGGHYNKSFKKLMVNHALEHFDLVVFYVNGKNLRSQKAMEKIGGWRIEDDTKSWVLSLEKGITYVIDEPL